MGETSRFASATGRGWLVVALFVSSACGGAGEPGYPSTDWSGYYATRAIESRTDCSGAESPPELGGFLLNLEHHPNNRATLQIRRFIRLTGEFEADSLVARKIMEQPVDLPDTLRSRLSAADSVETIAYRLRAAFADDTFHGRYVIRAPDMQAIARDSGPRRCEYRYELSGRRERVDESGRPINPPAPGESR